MKLKIIICAFLGLLGFAVLSAQNAAAFNLFCKDDSAGKCVSGVCADQPTTAVCTQNQQQNATKTNPALTKIHDATNLLALIASAAAVVLIIYAGYQFTTAGGSSESSTKTKEARGTITGALVGLVIIALAWTIVNFVVDRVIKT